MAKKNNDEEEFAKLVKSLSDSGRGRGGLATKADARQSRDVLGPLRPFSYVTVPVLAISSFFGLLYGFWISAIVSGCLGAAVIIFYLYSYFHWMRKDPDRLQTESYRLDERRLGLMAEKSIPLEISSLTDMEPESENPQLVPKAKRPLGQPPQKAIAAPVIDVEPEHSEDQSKSAEKPVEAVERTSRRRESKKKQGED
jgi:hypothetical protein